MTGFVKTYMPPEYLSQIVKNSSVEEFAGKLDKKRKKMFRKSLTEAKGLKPVYNKVRNRATIKLAPPSPPLSFIKIGEFWYIR